MKRTSEEIREDLLGYVQGSCKSVAEIVEAFSDDGLTEAQVTKVLEEEENMRICDECGWWADDGEWDCDDTGHVVCEDCDFNAKEQEELDSE